MDAPKKFYDERYEYNAPKEFIDFLTLKDEDDDAVDSYFG